MTSPSDLFPIASRRKRGWALWLLIAACTAALFFRPMQDLALRAVGQGPTPSTIAWRTDFDAARTEARQSGKPVMIDFTASWCPPCRMMERDTWPDDTVEKRVTETVIPLKLDVDRADVKLIAQRCGIESIPTILVVDANGTVQKHADYMTAADLIAFLKSLP